MFTRRGFGLFRWHRGRRRHRFGRRLTVDQLEEKMVRLEQHLEITPEQKDAWDDLIDIVRDGSEAFLVAGNGNGPETALERLARAEAKVEAGLAILKRIRPAFGRLYEILGEKQKQTVDGLTLMGRPHAARC